MIADEEQEEKAYAEIFQAHSGDMTAVDFRRDWEDAGVTGERAEELLTLLTGQELDFFQGYMMQANGAPNMENVVGSWNPANLFRGSWRGEPDVRADSMRATRFLRLEDRQAIYGRLQQDVVRYLRKEQASPSAGWFKTRATEITSKVIQEARWGVIGGTAVRLGGDESLGQKILRLSFDQNGGLLDAPVDGGMDMDDQQVRFSLGELVEMEIMEAVRARVRSGAVPDNEEYASLIAALSSRGEFWSKFTTDEDDNELTISLAPAGGSDPEDPFYGVFRVVRTGEEGTGRSDWPHNDDPIFINLKDYKTTNHHMVHMMQKQLATVGEYDGLLGLGVHPEPEHNRRAVIRLLGKLAFSDPALMPADLPGAEGTRALFSGRRLNPNNPWERRDSQNKPLPEEPWPISEGLAALYASVNKEVGLPPGVRGDKALHLRVQQAAEKAHHSATVVEREARRRWREGEITRLMNPDNPFSDEREILKGPPAGFEKLYERAWTRVFSKEFVGESASGAVGTRVMVEALGLYGSQ